jgi:hypothetical protein
MPGFYDVTMDFCGFTANLRNKNNMAIKIGEQIFPEFMKYFENAIKACPYSVSC